MTSSAKNERSAIIAQKCSQESIVCYALVENWSKSQKLFFFDTYAQTTNVKDFQIISQVIGNEEQEGGKQPDNYYFLAKFSVAIEKGSR